MTKQELRKHYLAKRTALNPTEYEELNNSLCNMFFAHIDLASVSLLHTFIPISRNKEPDTWRIINKAREDHADIKIAVPKINSMDAMESYYFEDEQQLSPNTWGIPEPKYGVTVSPSEIDMVLVPLLVFDKTGNRVGYGKGYYDRFLSTCRKDCIKVGLSLFEPIEKIDDLNEYDLPLNVFITPSEMVGAGLKS